ncbi:hypothetical protein L596_016457 [Steinernema carpocapsae]|uniref:Uncharacterized protein n=1 Tax=Steinernema carpocapsae TaxID=34508 RepID=A0A4U5NI51_STECR|nr:hypothetical protein L596_016457 [Steinernema carpocapsae]
MVLLDRAEYGTCCCGSVNVKGGACIIGFLYLIASLGTITAGPLAAYDLPGIRWPSMILAIFNIFFIFLSFYGIRMNRSVFLIPFDLTMLLNVLGLFGLAVVFLVSLIDPTSVKPVMDKRGWDHISPTTDQGVGFGASLLAFILTLWFWVVVHKCYLYLGGTNCCRPNRNVSDVSFVRGPFRQTGDLKFYSYDEREARYRPEYLNQRYHGKRGPILDY